MQIIKSLHIFLGNISGLLQYTFGRNRRCIRIVKPYLAKGVYRNSIYGDYIYEVSHEKHFDKLTFATFSPQSNFAKPILSAITLLFKYHCNTDGGFQGTELLISSSQQEYKVFNIDTAKVLTYYTSVEKLKKILQGKSYFATFFNVPQSIDCDIQHSILIEQYVPHKSFDKDHAFRAIASQYVEYAKHTNCIEDRFVYSNCVYFAQRFGDSLLLESIKKFPAMICHGDLWSSNIISNGSKFYITDFERVGERFFLFDLFCFIFSEYMINDDSSLLERYCQGDYDYLFSSVMDSCDMLFDNRKRSSYLLAFLVSITGERWRNNRSVEAQITKVLTDYISYQDTSI